MKNDYKRILDDMEKEALEMVAKEILQQIKEEKAQIKEEIKLLEEVQETIKRLDKKMEEFLTNDELSTINNLNKFLNVLKTQEQFLDKNLNNK